MSSYSVKSVAHSVSFPVLYSALCKIEVSDTSRRLAKGFFWSIAGALISRGLMLVAMVFVARMHGKSVYGELGIIQSTVAAFGTFAGFGLGLTATKYVAEVRRRDPEQTGRIIGIVGIFATITGGLMGLLLIIFAPWLAEHTINAPHLIGVLRIGAIMLFLSAINGAQVGVLSGFEAFKAIARVNLLVGLVSFPIVLAGAYWGGLTGTVWALSINLFFNWLLNHLALRQEAKLHNVPLTLKGCWREWPILWKFSLPAVLAGSMVGPVSWYCSAVLVNQPTGYDEMAIFNAANQWFTILLFLPGALSGVLLPILSDKIGQKNNYQSPGLLISAIKLNLAIVVPLVFVGCLASPYIMSLYGVGFANGWPTLIVVLLTAGVLAIQAPVDQMLVASGMIWTGLVMNMGWALIFIVSTFLMLDHGSVGLASARLLSYIAHSTWTFGFVYWLLRGYRGVRYSNPEYGTQNNPG